jgi:lipoic acid synthetase
MSHKPSWLKAKLPGGKNYVTIKKICQKFGLNTVCESALCPNIARCWEGKRLTFMILGDICTRSCRFCGVKKGKPVGIDLAEPDKISEVVGQLGLDYVIITSVTRDDLEDGGAFMFSDVVEKIHKRLPLVKVELLIPDFRGLASAVKKVCSTSPDVVAHNIETVPRLYSSIRPDANFERSIGILKQVKENNLSIQTKTGVMVGLGESFEEISDVMDTVARAKVDIFTIGQYLQPTLENYPVVKYYTPEEFEFFKDMANKKSIPYCYSGPFVRSSYAPHVA